MTTKINIISGLSLVTVLTLGLTSFAYAATYQYITTSGQLASVNADSSQQALATAPNIHTHSGVRLVSAKNSTLTTSTQQNQVTQQSGLHVYQYITTSGQLASVNADSAQQALATAPNIDAHSGVRLVK